MRDGRGHAPLVAAARAEDAPGGAAADGAPRRPLVILGISGNSLDILDIVAAINARHPAWRVVGFLDDAQPAGSVHFGVPALGGLGDAARLAGPGGPLADALFINAVGSERSHARRAELVARAGLSAQRFTSLVHPSAGVSAFAALGHGCCIGFGASIGGRASIGDHVWIGPACVVGHDSVLETCALMAPRSTISGHVRLGANCYVGSGAVVRQNVDVGRGALVGMGAVVVRDVAPGTTVAGNPARELERRTGAAE